MSYGMTEVLYRRNSNGAKKKWLSRYRNTQTIINKLTKRLDKLEQKITTISSPKLSGIPKGGNPVTTADLIADKMDLEDRISKLKKANREVKQEIIQAIDSIGKIRYIEILEYHFIDGMTMEEIADEMGYTLRNTYYLYQNALEALPDPDLQSLNLEE